MNTNEVLPYYFKLQGQRFLRLLRDNGLYPGLVLPMAFLIFCGLTFKLLSNFDLGEYLYAVLGWSLLSVITDREKVDFLKTHFSKSNFIAVRTFESLSVLFPFILGLVIYGYLWLALALMIFGGIYGWLYKGVEMNLRLPTPFGDRPFEFVRGFRFSFLLLMGCYVIMIIGLSVDNFNLSLASIAGIGLIAAGYYQEAEPKFYVWVHTMTAHSFLRIKMWTIIRNLSVLIFPIAFTLLIYSPANYFKILLITLASIAFVIMSMLAKYLAYPSQVNIVQALAMGASLFFPPLMLIIIPVFYYKAIGRLNPILP